MRHPGVCLTFAPGQVAQDLPSQTEQKNSQNQESGGGGGGELNNNSHFIPNDTVITAPQSLLLVTGPNMGGKSTLLR